MATYEEIMNAARNAHNAGDADAARRLVQMAQTMQQEPAAEQPVAEQPSMFSRAFTSAAMRNPLTAMAMTGDAVRGRLADDGDDTTQTGVETVARAFDAANESMSLGLIGDETRAAVDTAMGDENALQRRRNQEAAFQENNPYLSIVSEVAGGLLMPAGAAAQGTGILARSALGALGAGVQGGTYGFMEGDGNFAARRDNAIDVGTTSGVLGAAVPVVGAGIGRGIDRVRQGAAIRRAARNAPSAEDLRADAARLFDEVEQNAIPQQGVIDLTQQIARDGRASGMSPALTPRSTAALSEMTDVANSAGFANGIPMSEMNILRRQAGVAAGTNPLDNAAEAAIGSQMIEAIDDHVDQVSATLGEKGREARRMWGTLRRSEMLDRAFERAGRAPSGFENGLQIEFRRILNSPRLSRGFSAAEKRAMESVVNGGVMHGLLRQFGRLGFDMGGGSNAVGGLLGLGAGAATSSFVIPIAATGARKLSEVARVRSANRARDLVRTLDMPNLPQISQQGRGLLEDILLRSARSAGIASD